MKNKQFENQNNWIKENRERITIALPLGTKEKIKEAGFNSYSGYIIDLVLKDLEKREKNHKI